jgi:hypothetical protein
MCAVLAAAVAAALAGPAGAAAPVPQVTDQRGDANGLNHQGWLDLAGVPDLSRPSEPASYGPGDVLSVRWATTYARRRVTGFTVTMTLAAPPERGVNYLVDAVSPGCPGYLKVWYDTVAEGGVVTTVLCDGVVLAQVPPARVTGSQIVWTLPLAALQGRVRPGDVLSGLTAHTRAGALARLDPVPAYRYTGLRAPVLDVAVGKGTYRFQ